MMCMTYTYTQNRLTEQGQGWSVVAKNPAMESRFV